jgi:hypothetical protein
MSKRALRVVKHLGPVPCIAACTSCGKEFKGPLSTLPRVKDAQANLQEQFNRHKCLRQDVSRPVCLACGESVGAKGLLANRRRLSK